MHIEDLYNPKRVYEGFFETYFIRPFIHHYADFSGKESWKSFGLSLFAWFVITLGIIGIMLGQIGLIGPEGGAQATWWVCGIWLALSVVPILALLSRAFRGAPEKPLKSRMLGIDTLLGVSCLLFFVLGLLMMVTTLNSGELNPNARVYEETDTIPYEEEYIKEEPIFTYQDETPAPVEGNFDSMPETMEPDLEEAEESFDPTIELPLIDSI